MSFAMPVAKSTLPTIPEEDELPLELTLTSPEGDAYVVVVDPLWPPCFPTEKYTVAVTGPTGAVNAEGSYTEEQVGPVLQRWKSWVGRGGRFLVSLFSADEDE